MPPSDATVGFGSTIAFSTTENGSYTPVAQTRDLKSPEGEVGKVNITNNDSPDNCKESLPGMIDPGDMEFEIVYKKAQIATLYGMWGDKIVYWWKETYPDGSFWKWPAFVKKCATEGQTEDKEIIGKIALTLTGKQKYTAGT